MKRLGLSKKHILWTGLGLVALVLFQNCGLDFAGGPSTGFESQRIRLDGNGGGYAGFDVDGPTTARAGQSAVFRLSNGIAPYRFQLLAGDGRLYQSAPNEVTYETLADSPGGEHRIAFSDASGQTIQWNITVTLVGTAGVLSQDSFGNKVFLMNSLAVVGAPDDYNPSTYSRTGSVYVFRQDGSYWRNSQKLDFQSRAESQHGSAVAAHGTSLLVGANLWDRVPYEVRYTGRAYLFEEVNGVYAQKQIIEPPDLVYGDKFGSSVYLDGEYAFIGTGRYRGTGGVYVYRRAADGTLVFHQKLVPDRTVSFYGHQVDYSNGLLVVGTKSNELRGWIFVYKADAAGQFQMTVALPQQAGNGFSRFGDHFDVNGDWLHATESTGGEEFWVHDYQRQGDVFVKIRTMALKSAQFGSSKFRPLRASDRFLLVASQSEDAGGVADSGAVYLFERMNGEWVFRSRITHPQPMANDLFGIGLSIEGNRAIISGVRSGSIAVIEIGP